MFLSKQDALGIARSLGMRLKEFALTYCRWVDLDDGGRLALKERSSCDCVFWSDGCKIYETRPVQCRTYPFWPEMLVSREVWMEAAAECAGAGQGTLRDRAYIESRMALARSNPIMTREEDL